MQGILKAIVGSVSGITLQGFKTRCEDPAGTQNQVMNRIVRKNANTAFGIDHGFAGINDLSGAAPSRHEPAGMDGPPNRTRDPTYPH